MALYRRPDPVLRGQVLNFSQTMPAAAARPKRKRNVTGCLPNRLALQCPSCFTGPPVGKMFLVLPAADLEERPPATSRIGLVVVRTYRPPFR
jgi:hypothetical protein